MKMYSTTTASQSTRSSSMLPRFSHISGVAQTARSTPSIRVTSRGRGSPFKYNTTDNPPPQDAEAPCCIFNHSPPRIFTMAGTVRQPIDLQSLERYISQNVPEIKTPIDLKQ